MTNIRRKDREKIAELEAEIERLLKRVRTLEDCIESDGEAKRLRAENAELRRTLEPYRAAVRERQTQLDEFYRERFS
jgi:regulator of replication initiation timing